ncbi:NAD(P)-dependent oxidoreductase [Paenibacillus sepulcri]
MKLTIFGASGKTGQLLTLNALERGHTVTAYVRSPERFEIRHERLSVVVGTLEQDEAIGRAINGADAVAELVGAVSEGTKRIVTAMKQHGIRRLVAASACSVSDPNDLPDVELSMLVSFVESHRIENILAVRRAAEIIRASDLDWTLVRIPVLNDRPGGSTVKVGYPGRDEVTIYLSRADLASTILRILETDGQIRQAPVVSNSLQPAGGC